MIKKIALGVLLTFAVPALAQDSSSAQPAPVRSEIKDIRQNAQIEVRDIRQNVRTDVQNLGKSVREATVKNREDIRAVMIQKREDAEKLREEFKQRILEKREELKARIEKKREELKTRLERIRDERKKDAVMRIDKRLDEINDNRVRHFTENLNKIQKVLDNVSSRADKAVERGLDVAAARAAIIKAQDAINASKATVEAQAAKTYTLTVNTENTLRSDVGAARQALQRDLKAVFDTLRAAHDAVRVAAVTLAKIPRVDEEEQTGTSAESQ